METEEDIARDWQLRQFAFEWLERKTHHRNTALKWKDIESFPSDNPWGFALAVKRQGIFRPRVMVGALSIKTSGGDNRTDRAFRYNDTYTVDGYLRYKEQATRPHFNEWIHKAWSLEFPLIHFRRVSEGVYRANFPVYVIGHDPDRCEFLLDVSERDAPESLVDLGFSSRGEVDRSYASRHVEVREHQRDFRAMVMTAYRISCAVCALKHGELLDAAHVIGDREAGGVAAVKNGLALCKIHHSAFDSHILGVDPDYTVHIREDILHEVDGPMLKYGLQSHHAQKLRVVPEKTPERPHRELLAHRFEQFKAAV